MENVDLELAEVWGGAVNARGLWCQNGEDVSYGRSLTTWLFVEKTPWLISCA